MEFNIPVSHVRKDDRIYHNDQWRTVTETHQYLGDPNIPGIAWVLRVAKTDNEWDWSTYSTYGKQLNDDYEGPEYIWPLDCTDEITFSSWDDIVLIESDKTEVLDKNLNPIRWFVAVYELDQGYGGPEEGGWWFECGIVLTYAVASSYEEAHETAEKLKLDYQNTDKSYHVNYRGGEYRIEVRGSVPHDYPVNTPRYS